MTVITILSLLPAPAVVDIRSSWLLPVGAVPGSRWCGQCCAVSERRGLCSAEVEALMPFGPTSSGRSRCVSRFGVDSELRTLEPGSNFALSLEEANHLKWRRKNGFRHAAHEHTQPLPISAIDQQTVATSKRVSSPLCSWPEMATRRMMLKTHALQGMSVGRRDRLRGCVCVHSQSALFFRLVGHSATVGRGDTNNSQYPNHGNLLARGQLHSYEQQQWRYKHEDIRGHIDASDGSVDAMLVSAMGFSHQCYVPKRRDGITAEKDPEDTCQQSASAKRPKVVTNICSYKQYCRERIMPTGSTGNSG